MIQNKLAECHDCGEEITIYDKFSDLNDNDICYCALCGSDNISVNDLDV